MRKRLWIGSFVTEKIASELKEFGYKNPASVLSQSNILKGIEEVTGEVFDTIGVISLSGFPKQKKVYFDEIQFSHKDNSSDVLVGYLNIRYLNKIASEKKIVRKAIDWAKQNKEFSVDIYVYEMRTACIHAAVAIKKIIPGSRIILIVPDLPQYMDLSMSFIKKTLKKYDWIKIQSYFSYIDKYILYSKPMAKFLHLGDENCWMVMEGSINLAEVKEMEYYENNKTVVMYSGAIQQGFRIKNLLEAMEYLDDTYELWFTGGGSAVDTVKEYMEKDKRIHYYGFLPTREELRKLQMKASMMINMRDPETPASKYCFPSKLFEYLLLGKPVISPKLSGIPEEYYNYLIEMKSLKPQDIADAIERCANMENKEAFGLAGREFVITNKTNTIQATRILEFVEAKA